MVILQIIDNPVIPTKNGWEPSSPNGRFMAPRGCYCTFSSSWHLFFVGYFFFDLEPLPSLFGLHVFFFFGRNSLKLLGLGIRVSFQIYPLVNVYVTRERSTMFNWNITMLLMGKSTISMAMFNSYGKPEGTFRNDSHEQPTILYVTQTSIPSGELT